MDHNRVIGVAGKLPWHLPADLKRFKALTMGHHVIMGRKTYESLGKPLPGRTNVVVTRQKNYPALGCTVVAGLQDAFQLAQADSETFVIGGGELFALALPFADKLYITEVDMAAPRGDTFFPKLDLAQWKLIQEESSPPCRFLTYVTRRSS